MDAKRILKAKEMLTNINTSRKENTLNTSLLLRPATKRTKTTTKNTMPEITIILMTIVIIIPEISILTTTKKIIMIITKKTNATVAKNTTEKTKYTKINEFDV